MKRANEDIRRAIAASGLKHWEVAEKLNLSDSGFCKKLRKELTEEEKVRITEIIKETED